jgi:hypothetical protein
MPLVHLLNIRRDVEADGETIFRHYRQCPQLNLFLMNYSLVKCLGPLSKKHMALSLGSQSFFCFFLFPDNESGRQIEIYNKFWGLNTEDTQRTDIVGILHNNIKIPPGDDTCIFPLISLLEYTGSAAQQTPLPGSLIPT